MICAGACFPAIDARADQQLGAFVILFPGGMMSAIAALVLVGRLWRAERAAADGVVAYGAPGL